jgi:hypothetical protein
MGGGFGFGALCCFENFVFAFDVLDKGMWRPD